MRVSPTGRIRIRPSERGSAMAVAIALLVLSTFVIGAIMMMATGSRDTSRTRLESRTSEMLARDAGIVVSTAYSTMQSGEFDGFVPRQRVLARHAATTTGGRVRRNRDLPAAYRTVDPSVARVAPFTFSRPIEGAGSRRTGYWQLYKVVAPKWGVTTNGTVKAYVRTWADADGAGAAATRPMMHELTLRPEWMSDYQVLVDGKIAFDDETTIDGRVHSNGATSSPGDAWLRQPWQATLDFDGNGSGARCASTARVTTVGGDVRGDGRCRSAGGIVDERSSKHLNILRANDSIERIRESMCPGAPAATRVDVSAIRVVCPSTAGRLVVRLGSGAGVSVGGARYGVRGRPLVVLARGDIEVSGHLGPGERVLLIAGAPETATTYGSSGRPPSVWIVGGGVVGSNPGDASSSFGAIAQGSVILDEMRGCPSAVRGAFISASGGLSSNPEWQQLYANLGGRQCPAPLELAASVVGHLDALLVGWSMDGYEVGFVNQNVHSLASLYHNPPPVFPTTSDWQVVRFAPANLDQM